ncbi:hypothetical protein [Polaromonas jejuensis]|uniref:BED-type domain-containing protein n=1 Tax=Polaromonas jejuensis TaxID=457502 RepID=A0ABW0Q8U6_9BURK|nr:hypothetical protein [Polaromonas jejuensis]
MGWNCFHCGAHIPNSDQSIIDAQVHFGETPAAAPLYVDPTTTAALDVLAERRRQVDVEGWDAKHDDKEHPNGGLARATAAYALAGSSDGRVLGDELTLSRPGEEMYGAAGTIRAYCPLCKCGAQSTYSRGFSMPTGMRRHLEGSHGSRRCAVFSAAIDPCFEGIAEKAKSGCRGPNWEGLRSELPPWKIVPPEPVRSSAMVIKFPGI